MLPKSQKARPPGANETLWLDRSETIWVLHVDESASFAEVRGGLERALKKDKDALHGRNLYLGLGNRVLDLFDVRRISSQLREAFQASVVGVHCTAESIHRHVEQTFKLKIIPTDVFAPPPMPIGFTGAPFTEVVPLEAPEVEVSEAADLEEAHAEERVTDVVCADALDSLLDEAIPTDLPEFGDVEATDIVELDIALADTPIPAEGGRRVMVVERTLRSGSVIRFAGDVTIYGDVNAGAQVEADGNITVMGSLRGLAHAGARGDNRAVVIAFDMDAPQLRIAHRIGFSATAPVEPPAEATSLKARLQAASLGHLLRRDLQTDRTYAPEIAWIDEDQIRFEPYNGHLPN